MTALWTRFLRHNPADPTWSDRDRFVLSAGHGSALLYGLLHLSGYPLSLQELKQFRQWSSHTPGHPEYDRERGVETTTGPLGQGLSNGVGMALAERLLAGRFNRPKYPIVDHHTYVLASDGDLMEGISHEAGSLAGHLGLSRLTVLFDDNRITIDGTTDLTCSDAVLQRFDAYGWFTQRVDGHDMAATAEANGAAQAESKRPALISCRTNLGYGSPLEGMPQVHGAPFNEENVRRTKEASNWPTEPRFHVPQEVRRRFDQLREEGTARQQAWDALYRGYKEAHPGEAEEWEKLQRRELPADWMAALPRFSTKDSAMATRNSSGQVLDAIAPRLPSLIGGSADLTGSNKARPKGAMTVTRKDFGGSYIHFGVREHGMAGILNGLALHGLRPYGATFLVFSDYARPAIRMAALMGLPVIYVFTHDSIGLGEDGPTHQPVEHLTALPAIPNLVVIRPADGNETSQAWRIALERRDGPTALSFTRQKVPQVTPVDNELARGAYVLAEAPGPAPDVILIASGSEVRLALEARARLAKEQVAVRVVSMPSWELFDAQEPDYRESVLPNDVPRLAIEAGVGLGWWRYVRRSNEILSIERFGASAPYETLFEQFGFTVDRVVELARQQVHRLAGQPAAKGRE